MLRYYKGRVNKRLLSRFYSRCKVSFLNYFFFRLMFNVVNVDSKGFKRKILQIGCKNDGNYQKVIRCLARNL